MSSRLYADFLLVQEILDREMYQFSPTSSYLEAMLKCGTLIGFCLSAHLSGPESHTFQTQQSEREYESSSRYFKQKYSFAKRREPALITVSGCSG